MPAPPSITRTPPDSTVAVTAARSLSRSTSAMATTLSSAAGTAATLNRPLLDGGSCLLLAGSERTCQRGRYGVGRHAGGRAGPARISAAPHGQEAIRMGR